MTGWFTSLTLSLRQSKARTSVGQLKLQSAEYCQVLIYTYIITNNLRSFKILGFKRAVVETEYNYKHCCSDEEGTVPLNSTKLVARSCSQRVCHHAESLMSSVWISSQVGETLDQFFSTNLTIMRQCLTLQIHQGCDCCVVDGKLVEDKQTWIHDDQIYGKLQRTKAHGIHNQEFFHIFMRFVLPLECCRGDIVIQVGSFPNTTTNTEPTSSLSTSFTSSLGTSTKETSSSSTDASTGETSWSTQATTTPETLVFPRLEIQTAYGEYDNCDCNMTARFHSNSGNCSTEVLRNHANWYDDFEHGAVDQFTGSVLGTCDSFNPKEIVSVTITHKGADGWVGRYLKYFSSPENWFICSLNIWIKEADGVPQATFSCRSS